MRFHGSLSPVITFLLLHFLTYNISLPPLTLSSLTPPFSCFVLFFPFYYRLEIHLFPSHTIALFSCLTPGDDTTVEDFELLFDQHIEGKILFHLYRNKFLCFLTSNLDFLTLNYSHKKGYCLQSMLFFVHQ